ncbi:MAG: hypothetical protein IIC46_13550 [Planctomycetes bacterium]|nr:hypothetical protein [Planctomycetota bacterium]
MAKKVNKKVRKARRRPQDQPQAPVSPELKGILLADPDAKLPRLSLRKLKGPLSFLLAGGNLRDDA